MARTAEPDHIQRPRIVGMVALGLGLAAVPAGFLAQLAAQPSRSAPLLARCSSDVALASADGACAIASCTSRGTLGRSRCRSACSAHHIGSGPAFSRASPHRLELAQVGAPVRDQLGWHLAVGTAGRIALVLPGLAGPVAGEPYLHRPSGPPMRGEGRCSAARGPLPLPPPAAGCSSAAFITQLRQRGPQSCARRLLPMAWLRKRSVSASRSAGVRSGRALAAQARSASFGCQPSGIG